MTYDSDPWKHTEHWNRAVVQIRGPLNGIFQVMIHYRGMYLATLAHSFGTYDEAHEYAESLIEAMQGDVVRKVNRMPTGKCVKPGERRDYLT